MAAVLCVSSPVVLANAVRVVLFTLLAVHTIIHATKLSFKKTKYARRNAAYAR